MALERLKKQEKVGILKGIRKHYDNKQDLNFITFDPHHDPLQPL